MDLNDKFNKSYLNDKVAFQKVKTLEKNVEDVRKELKTIRRQIEDLQIVKIRAKEDKDTKAIKDADEEIKKLETKKREVENRGKKLLDRLKEREAKVNQHFEEIEKDPELKAHINSAMEKKYNREIKRVKEEQVKLLTLQVAIKAHPSIENNLKGMVRATEELEKLDEELKGLDPAKDKARIDEIKNTEIPTLASKKVKNKDMLKETLEKNKIDLPIEFVEKLVDEKSFKHYQRQEKGPDGKYVLKDDININKTLNNIAKSNENRIEVCKKTIEKIPGAVLYEGNQIKEGQEEDKEDKEEEQEGFFGKVKRVFTREDDEEQEEEEEQSLTKVEKLSWWRHPIKRFKQWREERNADIEEEPKEEQKETTKTSEKFRSAYKYDVVQDYMQNYEKRLEQEAKQEIKANKDKTEDKEER